MPQRTYFIDQLIINSPYVEPGEYWSYDRETRLHTRTAGRRQGLPITSSHVESTIKRINRRMKGTEKFWDAGAEPLIHLAADHLSPTDQQDRYWSARPQRLCSQRCYQQAA
jgi:hypothetical protein